MRVHFTAAQEYARDLGRDQVTVVEKRLIVAISDYYDPRYNAANIALSTLENDTLIDRRYIRRLLRKLAHLVDYRPAVGSGNFGRFHFPGLLVENDAIEMEGKGVKRGQKGGKKGVIDTPPIRKDLNLNPDQEPHPNPPFQGGDHFLTVRDRRRLNDEVYALMRQHLDAYGHQRYVDGRPVE